MAAWLAKKKRWSDDRSSRLDQIWTLPILPIECRLQCHQELGEDIITLRALPSSEQLPDWLPLRFIDDWFKDQIGQLSDDHPVRTLVNELDIKPADGEVAIRALARAIEAYWEKPVSDPDRFINILISRDWHEQFSPVPGIGRCPILADLVGGPAGQWVESGNAYFGSAWGNGRLEHSNSTRSAFGAC